MVKPYIVNKRKNKDNLQEPPDPFLPYPGNRLFPPQKERTGNHKENGHCRLHPERYRQIERIKQGRRPGNVQGEAGGGCMGKHDKPYAQGPEKLNMKFLRLRPFLFRLFRGFHRKTFFQKIYRFIIPQEGGEKKGLQPRAVSSRQGSACGMAAA